jgi:hypothetical protein
MRHPRPILFLLLTGLAAACGAQPPAPSTPAPASLQEIAGQWDIVRFDGHPPPRLDNDGQRHAYVDVDRGSLRFSVGCNHSGMSGRIESGILYPAPVDDGMQTSMGCGIEREARDDTFFKFFRARPRVALLPGGRLRMVAPGHELVLERPSVRRLAMGPALSEITGIWRVDASRGSKTAAIAAGARCTRRDGSP